MSYSTSHVTPNISPRFHITPGFISSCPVAPFRRSATDLLVELPHALRHLLRSQRGKLLHQLGEAAEARQMRKPGGQERVGWISEKWGVNGSLWNSMVINGF